MIIPDATTATWQEMCLAFAKEQEEAAVTYRYALDAGPEYIHNQGKHWATRQEHLRSLLGYASQEAEIWHQRAKEDHGR